MPRRRRSRRLRALRVLRRMGPQRSRAQQKKRDKRDVHGWVVLDKPVGMTSTHAVSVVKRLFTAKTRGPRRHARSTGLRRAADRTWRSHQDGSFRDGWSQTLSLHGPLGRRTRYRRRRRACRRDQRARPTADAICAALPAFTGLIQQVPPRYSAIKIEGERAYDLAREGETVELAARPVEIGRLELLTFPDADHAVLEAECGKGTYVRSLARDLGRTLGCFGHVSALRRASVGPFSEETMILLEQLEALCHRAASVRQASPTL